MSPSISEAHARHLSKLKLKAEYGELPYRCHFCNELIYLDGRTSASSLNCHHLDGDVFNMDIDNLVPAHGGCHSTYHNHKYRIVRGRKEFL